MPVVCFLNAVFSWCLNDDAFFPCLFLGEAYCVCQNQALQCMKKYINISQEVSSSMIRQYNLRCLTLYWSLQKIICCICLQKLFLKDFEGVKSTLFWLFSKCYWSETAKEIDWWDTPGISALKIRFPQVLCTARSVSSGHCFNWETEIC